MPNLNALANKDLTRVAAAILAGGFGTRLRSIISDKPKVLAEIRGKPFLAFLLDQLVDVGVRYVVLCTGYLGKQVQDTFGDSYGNLHLVYSQESSPLGTAGALRLALPLFKSDSVLTMNGDSFCDVNLNVFWAWHCERSANATLLLTKVLDTKWYGRVHVDTDGLVLGFDEKDDKGGSGWINAGIYLLTRSLLLTIPVNRAVSLEREMFPAWVGRSFYGYRSNGRFLDIGSPETYAVADQFFTEDVIHDH
jgi:NDP-sugar pyrophosphorylase family protein